MNKLLLACALGLLLPASNLVMARQDTPPPDVPKPVLKDTCIVLFAGGGTVSPREEQNQAWFKIDSVVSDRLKEALEARGYDIVPLVVDIRDMKERAAFLVYGMQSSGCGVALQLTHGLRSEKPDAEMADFFSFDVTLLTLDDTMLGKALGHEPYSFGGNYTRKYEYPLTKETMDTLSMTEVAEGMATDIEKAGVLKKPAH